jgi:Heterokaryon incompatibility protein (HET)
MRLINIKTYEVQEFFANHAPKYYALSHTWLAAGEEVSLRDWQTALEYARKEPPSTPTDDTQWIGRRMKVSLEKLDKAYGFDKIQGCMRKASRDVDYCWVDTVCIDKSSSAELSEAINSMFRIYRDCEICIAYLVDVQKRNWPFNTSPQEHLIGSRWFTRGWTVSSLVLLVSSCNVSRS